MEMWHSKDDRNVDVSTLYDVFDWNVFMWRIHNPSLIPRAVDYAVQSPIFYFKNASWILKMYPYGQTEFKTEGYVDVIIERVNSDVPRHNVCCKIYYKNASNEKRNHKKLQLGFDSEWTFSRVHYFMPSLEESELNNPFTLVVEFGVSGMAVNKSESETKSIKFAVDQQYTMNKKKRFPEIGEIIKEYLEFKSLCWKVYCLPAIPYANYQAPSPPFSFANGSWILKAFPCYPEHPKKLGICVVMKSLDSEISEQNVTFKVCQTYPNTMSGEKSAIFNSSHLQEEVLHFPYVCFFHLTLELKIKIDFEPGISYDNISRWSSVLQNFKNLFLSQEDADVIIKVKGKEFPAHRLVLKAQSPVFAATFRCDMQEKATGIIDIQDCDPSIFVDFLYFLYCGEVRKLSLETAFKLFIVADKYNVSGLMSLCMEFIKMNLSIVTFCDIITLAQLYSNSELIELSTDFFAENLQEIIATANWKSFVNQNPNLSNELKIKAQMLKRN